MEAEDFNDMAGKDDSAFKKDLFATEKGGMRSQRKDGTGGD